MEFIKRVESILNIKFATTLDDEAKKHLVRLYDLIKAENPDPQILKILQADTTDYRIFWIYTEPEFGIAINITDPELSEIGYLPYIEEKHHVFVYGTLRKGYGNHHYLKNAEFLGMALTKEKYTMYAAGIPFVSHRPSVRIRGEVYKVTEVDLMNMDRLEGHPDWYKRELVPVILEDGTEIKAWLYFNDNETGEIVETGDYADYREFSFERR